eukprot:scaffold1341_cov178-Amphora_coffeaeformis.AAC.35
MSSLLPVSASRSIGASGRALIVARHTPLSRNPLGAASAAAVSYRCFAASAQKRAAARKKKEVVVQNEKPADAAKTVTLSSDFDDDCAVYISNLLGRFPVIRKGTPDFGLGLFASRDIQMGSEVIFGSPAFVVTQRLVDRLEDAVDRINTRAPLHFGSNSFTVAAMVEETLASVQYPCKPSEYLPIRCLGSIPKSSMSVELAFQLIGESFQLPSTVWTKEECLLLHNKVATNKVDQELYIATSMFNHNCDFNVAWSP